MIWGPVNANGTAGIYIMKPNTTRNGAKYAELLRDKLPTHMAIHQALIFMRNGAPCHHKNCQAIFYRKSHQDPRLAWE